MTRPSPPAALDLAPLGDRAFLARFPEETQAAAWAAALRALDHPGILEVVSAYSSVGVYADPEQVDLVRLEHELRSIVVDAASPPSGRTFTVPTVYDGPDLRDASESLHLTVEEFVAAHSAVDYHVFAIGFLPGFPYAGYLPEKLQGLPRRPSPRTRVPAGSVAVVGRQTAIYPQECPGGWHLIGRTPLSIVDVERARFPIRAGDRLRFVPIDAEDFESRRGELI